MVGEGVLNQCLNSPHVEAVLVINRRTCGVTHPKLKEILHADFFHLTPIESQLQGYDACFLCLGISSVGISKEDYYKTTYTLTMHFGETLSRLNPEMICTYISGAGTDSSENGRSHWARVKGKTENDLKQLSFRKVYAYRPGFIKPIEGMKHTKSFYKYINWLFPIGKSLMPDGFNTLQEVGDSMIAVAVHGFDGFILNGKEISATAKSI